MSETSTSATRQIARGAGLVMAAFVLSNLVGLLRQILMTAAFGTETDMEAFNAANRVSEILFNLLAGGALASAFIPTFTALLTVEKRQGAWKLASAVTNLLLVILTLVSALAAMFAPQIVRYILAPGFANDPAKITLTIELMRVMLPTVVIFGLSGVAMGVLNSHQSFFIPALAPSMYQLGMIFGILVLSPRIGIFGLAWGVVIGASLHMLLQIPFITRLGGRYYATFGLKNPAVHEVARLMGPRLLGVAVVQLNFLVNTRLASYMLEGSVTAIVLAFSLLLMPQAAIAQSIAIAALPTFSAQVALGKLDQMRATLASSLRGILLLSVPATMGLILLREPIIVLLYQHGEFGTDSTQLVSWALLWFAVGLVGHAVVEIMARSFFALHDTKTPVAVGIAAMSLNVLFSILFSRWFQQLGWMPHGGLALANSVATALEMVGLLFLMRRQLYGLDGHRIMQAFVPAFLATVAMSLVLWGWLTISSDLAPLIRVGGGLVIGAGVYGILIWLLGVSEAKVVVRALENKIKK
jgi:putative peptidoglycan lipid II flippase